MKRKIWLTWTLSLVLFLIVPLTWALDMEPKQVNIETRFSEVNLDNFERPLLGQFQTYFNLNGGITRHDDQTMFGLDIKVREAGSVPLGFAEEKIRESFEQRIRDRWNQWNTGGELGFGITDKITARVWGNFNLPAASDPHVSRQADAEQSVFLNGVLQMSQGGKLRFSDEDTDRWRKSENFGASLAYRPFPNWEFYAVTDGRASWFREDINYKFFNNFSDPADFDRFKNRVRERSYTQEITGGFKYIFDMPAANPKIAALDLRRSPQPQVVDLVQWDRALLHMGEFMINPFAGARFVDQRQTFYSRFGLDERALRINEIRNWPIFTFDETARDHYTQAFLGANAAVGITDCLLLEGGYKHYLPVDYKRNVTRKFGNEVIYFDEHDRGKNEGWAGNAKFTFRFNPWFQAYTGYTGWSDRSQFLGNDFFVDAPIGSDKGMFERRLAEHRAFGGFTFLTPVKGETNPPPGAMRTFNDFQRPLLRPFQFGANIYGGWRYVKDQFISKMLTKEPRDGTGDIYRGTLNTDRSFSQGFLGGDLYLGIMPGLQFETSGHFYAPTRYGHRATRNVTDIISGGGFQENSHQFNYHSGEESSWDVSPRLVFRPRPNFEAFLGADFGQVRTVRNKLENIKAHSTSPPPIAAQEIERQKFIKNETIYNVNAGIKFLF